VRERSKYVLEGENVIIFAIFWGGNQRFEIDLESNEIALKEGDRSRRRGRGKRKGNSLTAINLQSIRRRVELTRGGKEKRGGEKGKGKGKGKEVGELVRE